MAEELGITLATADARLKLYLAAEARVLANQSYKIGDREMTRADLAEIRAGIEQWNGWVQRLNPSAKPVGRVRRGSYRSR